MPKISVIVPVYKVETYLDRCVQSILRQTYTDFQLILIDDGSPDACPAMCDEYAKQHTHIIVIHQKNGGLSAARNAGIDWAFSNSNSEWLTFLDSDDWIHPEYLERLFQAATINNVVVSVCGFARTQGDDPIIEHNTLTPVLWNSEDFYVEENTNAVIACGKLYRKDLFQNIRYPIGKIYEDEFTTHKLLFQYNTVAVIPAPLYAYFVNADGITSTGGSPHLKVEACSDKVLFFEELGLSRAHDYAVDALVFVLPEAIKNARSKTEASTFRRMLRIHLKEYEKRHGHSIESKPWYYEAAYPCRMRFYWLVKAILNKLKFKR